MRHGRILNWKSPWLDFFTASYDAQPLPNESPGSHVAENAPITALQPGLFRLRIDKANGPAAESGRNFAARSRTRR